MATYYVKLASQGGSNSNNGTSEATAIRVNINGTFYNLAIAQ